MDLRKIIGLVVIAVGAICLFFSDYIANQVAEGKLRIQRGQQSVNTINSLFSSSQYTEPFGKTFTGSAQRKIDRGQQEVAHYENLSNQLKVGGIVLIGIGLVIFFVRKRR